MNGIIVIDKPQDFTSFDVVAVMRRLCAQKKIGHTGTLDPMATGVLPLLLGNATRAQSLLPDDDKAYTAQFKLGLTTDTLDITGKVLAQRPYKAVTKEQVLQALAPFRGNIMQTPPMYSAVQKDGQRLYDLARKGIEVQRAQRPVTVKQLSLLSYDEKEGTGTIEVTCSKGTYIRSLIDDIGAALCCGGVLTALRRTKACGFALAQAITLDQMKELSAQGQVQQRLLCTESLFTQYGTLAVTQKQAVRFKNGGALDLARVTLPPDCAEHGIYRVTAPDGLFLGLGEVQTESRELSVLKLFYMDR